MLSRTLKIALLSMLLFFAGPWETRATPMGCNGLELRPNELTIVSLQRVSSEDQLGVTLIAEILMYAPGFRWVDLTAEEMILTEIGLVPIQLLTKEPANHLEGGCNLIYKKFTSELQEPPEEVKFKYTIFKQHPKRPKELKAIWAWKNKDITLPVPVAPSECMAEQNLSTAAETFGPYSSDTLVLQFRPLLEGVHVVLVRSGDGGVTWNPLEADIVADIQPAENFTLNHRPLVGDYVPGATAYQYEAQCIFPTGQVKQYPLGGGQIALPAAP